MSLRHKVSFFALLFSLLFFSPHAVHGRHRSSALHHQHVHRQVDLPDGQSGLGNALSGLGLDSGGTSPPPSSQPSTSSTDPGSSSAPSTSPPQSTSSSQTSNSPASLPSTSSPSTLPLTSSPASSSPPTSGPTSSPTITSPQSSQTPSSQPSSPTSSCSLVDLFGQCILPDVLSTTSSGSTPASSAPTDVPSTSLPSSQPQTSTSLTSSSVTPTSPLLSSNPISLPPLLSTTPTSSPSPSSNNPASLPSSNTPASLPSSSTNAPASSPPLSSNTPISLPLTTPSVPISLPLSSISSPPSSLNSPVSSPSPAASSPPVSSTDLPSQSSLSPTNSQPAPSLSDNQSSSPSPPPSSSTPIDPCGPVGLLLGLCFTSSGTPIRTSIPSSGSTPQQTLTLNPSSPILNSQSPPFSIPSTSNSGVSLSSGLPVPLSYTSSLGPLASGTVNGTVSGSLTTSAPPVISFPSDTTSSGNQTSSVQSTGPFSPAVTLPPNSQFSYVTMTSLLGTSLQSSSIPPTLTNPDAATTTFSLPDPSISATGSAPGAPLPSYLPARIYAPDQDAIDSLPSDYTICSFLFTSFLSWAFVAQNTQSQGQIFSWAPVIIATALNISTTQTPPYALQVFTPATYDGPSDVSMLLTEYLFFLPDEYVSVLANQIKATDSPFYTDVGYPYIQLASQIDPAFALTSVSNPSAVPGSASGASSHGNKRRTDTIIGVVSGLGGLALIILGILIFNGVKRSRQLRHLRLSDPNLPNDPYPDRSGREFDQDSVGGPRRRSFYFAEDSLRGGQPQTAEQSVVSMAQAQTQYVTQPESQIQYIPRTSPENIRERRAPVVPGAISAPILTQSSLNW